MPKKKKVRKGTAKAGKAENFVHKFRIPIYEIDFQIAVADSIDAGKKLIHYSLRGIGGGEQEGPCQAMFFANHPKYAIIIKHDSDHGTLDHEVGHVARKIMEDIGFKIEASNDEPLAYLEGWITNKIYKLIYVVFDKL